MSYKLTEGGCQKHKLKNGHPHHTHTYTEHSIKAWAPNKTLYLSKIFQLQQLNEDKTNTGLRFLYLELIKQQQMLLPLAISVMAMFFRPARFSTRTASSQRSGQCGFFSRAFSRMDRAFVSCLLRSSRRDNNSQSGMDVGHFFICKRKSKQNLPTFKSLFNAALLRISGYIHKICHKIIIKNNDSYKNSWTFKSKCSSYFWSVLLSSYYVKIIVLTCPWLTYSNLCHITSKDSLSKTPYWLNNPCIITKWMYSARTLLEQNSLNNEATSYSSSAEQTIMQSGRGCSTISTHMISLLTFKFTCHLPDTFINLSHFNIYDSKWNMIKDSTNRLSVEKYIKGITLHLHHGCKLL